MRTQFFTYNSKTILSIDFDRNKTCGQICSYCYVNNTERIYKAYSNKITKNYEEALYNSDDFAKQLNSEYTKLRNSKTEKWKRLSKLPIRIYGSGDYIPGHFNFINKLNFKSYIISKNLTLKTMKVHISKLLSLENITNIVLSFDSNNIINYDNVKTFYGKDRIAFAFTGTVAEFSKVSKLYQFDIFFNINKDKNSRKLAQQFKEQCPCDTGLLKHDKACSYCNKCWRSTKTKVDNWNN